MEFVKLEMNGEGQKMTYGSSYINKIMRHYREMRLMEDASLIYRTARTIYSGALEDANKIFVEKILLKAGIYVV